jgi:hypothetical protein
MKKFEALPLRGKLYYTVGTLGTFAEEYPDNEYILNAYDLASQALDELESYCIKMQFIDQDTLEVIE